MTLLQGIVLAVVQGLTEFLPVSSTAHLILVPWLLGWEDPGLTYDVVLHAGTLLAVVVYFARDWLGMLGALFGGRVPTGLPGSRRLLGLIVLATIPAALAGYFLESYAESVLRGPLVVAGALIAVGLLMGVADRRESLQREVKSVEAADAIIIGVAQAVALVPGTSRAGITIAAGLFRNLTRESAARFSFLLATPILAGATVKKAWEVWQQGFPPGLTGVDFAVGFGVAAVTGYAAISFLLRYLQVGTLKIFVAYRLALGVIILGVEFLRSAA
ncbi:MAG: undecaprenyl-diphosphatase UppP [Candidatus Acidoferrales bacterium]